MTKKLSQKLRKEMTKALVKDVGEWGLENLIEYTSICLKKSLEKMPDEQLIAQYHHNQYPQGVCPNAKCSYCRDNREGLSRV